MTTSEVTTVHSTHGIVPDLRFDDGAEKVVVRVSRDALMRELRERGRRFGNVVEDVLAGTLTTSHQYSVKHGHMIRDAADAIRAATGHTVQPAFVKVGKSPRRLAWVTRDHKLARLELV